jgi:tRNA nucleotidyltransferase (CCA-adding enzyme)
MTNMENKPLISVPEEVSSIVYTLEDAGFKAYLVGGCVRDALRGVVPKDWDVATNATPDKILELFPHAHYDNEFGTVRVVNDETKDDSLKVVEVTTFRLEHGYSDNRRPDRIEFSQKLEDDLKRRDFTMNAIAGNVSREMVGTDKNQPSVSKETIIDPFSGLEDISRETIQAVGDPHERFSEDALRMLRAIRFSSQLGFVIEQKTADAIQKNAKLLETIAIERVKDEFVKIIMSDRPSQGLQFSHNLGLLEFFIPELIKTIDIAQNKAHSYTLWEHLLRSLQATADKGWDLEIRLSALFHDISKEETRLFSKEKNDWTFHGHEVVGSRETRKILKRLKFSRETIEKVSKLVRWHMFFSDPDEITLSAVRRLINKVGKENVWDLMNVRIADRIGTGRPKEEPYRLRKYKSMLEEAMRDPITVGMLKIDGNVLIKDFNLRSGPKIGFILHALLEEVLDDPKRNTKEYLNKKVKELLSLSPEELQQRGEEGKIMREKEEEEEVEKIRSKYWVK